MHFLDTQQESVLKEKEIASFIKIKNFIREKKYVFFFLIFLIAFATIYLFRINRSFRSEIQLYFTGFNLKEFSETASEVNVPLSSPANSQYSKLYKIVYSKEMLDYLIQKFDLYAHYKINTSSANSYMAVRRALRQNIVLIEGPAGVLLLDVRDAFDNKLTAGIANEIGRRANEVNKNIFIQNMKRRIEIYSDLYTEIKIKTSEDTRYLNSSIDSMSKLINSFNKLVAQHDMSGYSRIARIENQFHDLENRIEQNVNAYLETSKIYTLTLKTIEQDKLPFITVLQEALPDDGTEITPMWGVMIIAFSFAILLAVILFFLYYHYAVYLKLIFR